MTCDSIEGHCSSIRSFEEQMKIVGWISVRYSEERRSDPTRKSAQMGTTTTEHWLGWTAELRIERNSSYRSFEERRRSKEHWRQAYCSSRLNLDRMTSDGQRKSSGTTTEDCCSWDPLIMV